MHIGYEHYTYNHAGGRIIKSHGTMGEYVDRNRFLNTFTKERIRREIFDFDINNGNIKIKGGCDCLEIDSFIYCGFEINP